MAHAAALLLGGDEVFLEVRALAVAVDGDGQEVEIGIGGSGVFVLAGHLDLHHADDGIVVAQVDPLHAGRVPPHRACVALAEADGHAAARAEEQVVVPIGPRRRR